MSDSQKQSTGTAPAFSKRRALLFGKDSDSIIKTFFGSNAMVAILILALITIFLFKEGAGFLGLYHKSIEEYRLSGLEYVDILKEKRDDYTDLTRYLNETKAEWINGLKAQGLSQAEISKTVFAPESKAFFLGYMRVGSDLRRFVKTKMDVAIDTRDQYLTNQYLRESGETITLPVNFDTAILNVTDEQARYAVILTDLESSIDTVLAKSDAIDFNSAAINKRIEKFKELNARYITQTPYHLQKLADWEQHAEVSQWLALGAFLTGKDWVTASDQQDWYGLLPLLTGSLLISSIALAFAIPFGVGAAIYVNQIAGAKERNFIKPYIEFISAIPSVVIGFFGIVVLGEAIRLFSQIDALQWIPFFPVQERLNSFTAGCLLALMAIPTIFTLSEDAINNIPWHFKEASLAMGASRLQTTLRVIVPSALSGIVSAIMLGFGRVIGETMVVLLCAGNRIKIPDFTKGLGVAVEPVHTMTGIIAQEMGEVVQGSLHYRALFMVGIVLFFASLLINYGAQWVVKRYSTQGD